VIKGTPIAQGFQGLDWSLELTLDFMSRNNIGASILSCAIPLTIFNKSTDETATLAREINQCMAKLRDKNPTKLKFFAVLPGLDDVSLCIDIITLFRADSTC
jgi:hypothetical protein